MDRRNVWAIYVMSNTKDTNDQSHHVIFFFSFLEGEREREGGGGKNSSLPLGFARLHRLQSYQAEGPHIH